MADPDFAAGRVSTMLVERMIGDMGGGLGLSDPRMTCRGEAIWGGNAVVDHTASTPQQSVNTHAPSDRFAAGTDIRDGAALHR